MGMFVQLRLYVYLASLSQSVISKLFEQFHIEQSVYICRHMLYSDTLGQSFI